MYVCTLNLRTHMDSNFLKKNQIMRFFGNIFKTSAKSNPIFLGWSFFICIKYWFRTFHRISWFGCIRGICNSLLWAQCKFSALHFYYLSYFFSQYIFSSFCKISGYFHSNFVGMVIRTRVSCVWSFYNARVYEKTIWPSTN